MSDPADLFWKSKLAAFLHDPPSKCINLYEHEEWSQKAMSAAGLDDTKYLRLPDWEASAADRIPFPKSRPASVSCAFDGVRAGFHHPLGGTKGKPCTLYFEKELSGLDHLEGKDSEVQPVLDESSLIGWPREDVDRARFFAHWRLWRHWAGQKDWRFHFLPADTRLPDHSIWHHMQVTSALAGCAVSTDPKVPLNPAFLKLQIGPVQDFIAAARSIRDLWSGSYLLSWLMAAGLKKLSELCGPDSVLFPSLWGQPLFDLHWRDSLWSKVSMHQKARKCWDDIKPSNSALLTPNLPNVFLALVPADQGRELAQEVEKAIRSEFRKIADHVWDACETHGLCADEPMITAAARKERFYKQIDQFLSISWQVTPWPTDLEKSLALAPAGNQKMPASEALQRIQSVRNMAEKHLPDLHRDSRYYHNTGKPDYKINEPAKLKSRGLAWSVILAHNAWELDGVRNLRSFRGQGGSSDPATCNNKDSLTGKEEAVAGGTEWMKRVPNEWKYLFKDKDAWIGSITLIKRIWHLAYLKAHWGLPTEPREFSMPNLHSLAKGDPFGDDETPEPATGEKHFAVLAFDGDEIGKWISGEKTPCFSAQLADYMDGSNSQRHGILEYFKRDLKFAGFLNSNRPLSPSYHLQFSEALGNFAIHCAASIVEGHNGRLIYCGGDDVLAVLPAENALECAQDLNRAFTGQAPSKSATPRTNNTQAAENDILQQKSIGFLSSKNLHGDNGTPIPFVVPGPAASASVGIAIAHFTHPLQDVVRAAQKAEKRAKNSLGRAAVAVTLFKRSGEITEWGTKWQSGGLALYDAIAVGMANEHLSRKFPHRICQLLEPYLIHSAPLVKQAGSITDSTDFDAIQTIKEEFRFAISRQSTKGHQPQNEKTLLPLLENYFAGINEARLKQIEDDKSPPQSEAQELLTSLIGLCTTVAFAHRTQSKTSE